MDKEYLIESAEYIETSTSSSSGALMLAGVLFFIGLIVPFLLIFAVIALCMSFKSTTVKKWTGRCPKCQKSINFIGNLGAVFKDGFNGGRSEDLKNTRHAEFNCPLCKSKLILNDSKFVYQVTDIDRL